MGEIAALEHFHIGTDVAELKELLAAVFAESLNISLTKTALSPEEERMTALLAQRHASEAWVLAGVTEMP